MRQKVKGYLLTCSSSMGAGAHTIRRSGPHIVIDRIHCRDLVNRDLISKSYAINLLTKRKYFTTFSAARYFIGEYVMDDLLGNY